jgi:hypothetical protein
MTVAQLIEQLQRRPCDAVVLMDNGGGLSRMDAGADRGGAPATVILSRSMEE